MLRPGTSRLLFSNFPRVHVKFFHTTPSPKQDLDSRPPRPNDPSKGSTLESQSEYTPTSSPSSSRPVFSEAGKGIEQAQSLIRRWTEQNSIAFRQRADSLIARIGVSFTRLGGEINRVTGYDEIEALKRHVVSQGTSEVPSHSLAHDELRYTKEARISSSRKAARDAKVAYEESVQKRSDSQREVNSLLERKSMWADADVSRFTALVRQDHALEQAEARAKAAVARTEDEVEREFSALMRTILARYHEEQVWSDKIRSVSTYGQLAVLGVNVLVFVLAIVLVEPWKRRRLMQAFELRVQEMEAANVDAVVGGMDALKIRLEELEDRILDRFAEASSTPPPLEPALTTLWEERMRAMRKDEPPRPEFEFPDIPLVPEDAKLAAASVAVGVLAWALLRSWLGL